MSQFTAQDLFAAISRFADTGSALPSEQTSGTRYEIVQTDAEIQEREDWITYVASLEPEDPEFEAELEQWESGM